MHTKESLIAFEARVARAFTEKKIRAPVHFCGGNEDQLISIFHEVHPQDWVFSTWRSAYHALLKGIPEEWVYDEILAGRSMYLINKEHNFLCSSIVGGILPIACGVAMGIEKHNTDALVRGYYGDLGWMTEKVWVFVGDMTARTGIFHEFEQYCQGHNLPVRIVVEDNGLSTNTPTDKVWGMATKPLSKYTYTYERTYPHVGLQQRVEF